jgi:asparagine synthase (glutamine-hydrolysing)
MCGIAGIIGLGSDLRPEERGDLEQMTRLLHHRGPDSRGVHITPRVGLGNTRLKILDLSEVADLPMSNREGTVWIAYNGEVTNFRELERRYGLRAKYPFKTTSDTEVLIYLYEELGIDFLAQLTGMFAFCLYDSRVQKAWVVRDFYGIRPLFVTRTPDRLYFASEIKAFLDLPGFDPTLDHQGLYDYFTLAYIPRRHTPFANVEEVDGGWLYEIDLARGHAELREYYELRYEPDPNLTGRTMIAALADEMADSVRRNLISDAPLGLTYSGGFDTSSILALAREHVPQVHTYSIVMEERSFDESHYQYQMVDPHHHTHHEVRVGPKLVADHFVEHVAFMDEPSGNGACLPSYLLAKEAKQTVDVLLSGEGGDETFNAYETHVANKARRLYRRVPEPARQAVRSLVHALPVNRAKLSFDFVAKRFTTGSEMDVPESHIYWRHVLTDADKDALMPGLVGRVEPTHEAVRDLYQSVDFADELNRVSLLDWKYYFLGDLMVKNDRTMMAHSVEARFPFADRLLLEFVSRIPVDQRIRRFRRRWSQKEAMRSRVPKAIYKRNNFGLEMPHSIWFLGELRPFIEHYLAPEMVARAGFLDTATVARLWDEHRRGLVDHGRALWCILNLLVWMDLFVFSKRFKDYLHLGAAGPAS